MSKVQAQIISIGDELLLGETINTNASFIAKSLQRIGIEVSKVWTIADIEEQMIDTIKTATSETSLVLMTGGLGPTNDDKTQKVLCSLTKDSLVQNKEVFELLKARHASRGKRDNWEVNKNQALVPSNAKIFINTNGTAPGLWIQYNNAVCIALPGVPFEMEALLTEQVLPAIQEVFTTEHIYYRTLLTYGLGESVLLHRLKDWEEALPSDVKLAYLPSNSQVRLRLLGSDKNKEVVENKINKYVEELAGLLPDVAVGIEEETNLIEQIKKKLDQSNSTLSLAESVTGGELSIAITQEPGVSTFYAGGVITYATASKVAILGIDPSIIKKHSVVSAEVAKAMAKAVSKLYHTDYALATTGQAGPTKGDSDAEIGTVFIALKTPTTIKVKKHQFGKVRRTVIKRATNAALTMLWKEV